MNRRLHTALAVTAALGAGLLMTACGGSDKPAASATSPSATATASSTPTATDAPTATATGSADTSGSDKGSSDKGSADKASSDKGAADKTGYGQACGTNDITWSVTSESQAGGYFLIKAKANPGITCVLPIEVPVVAFGSDGTEAAPAEQSAGRPITLRAGVTVYAGVNPKTTPQDGGKELDSLILSVSDTDPNPVSVKVGSYVVDKPIVTDWHTSATDAVPFSD
ncbi:DUF4232 domain-containing protein [Actinacidiphila bryophytorum]|uniref:DUF4232 domain-containing protein n=1 Tax=Actinacidiphila bryophytorum TaxID=1436133 RepID=A0A9W4MC52_9ACTN|nr:DUF4232 domain-containing protein [Actinacidiphila bryophytorum]MBM9435225.1 DUF4232 domain-containing protein [Actinacidiphila bryophytorum]MBN6545809.1 DUF4232 domain-containing protein [Actinacidiphila bryophytorum]CAG7643820.1 conserved exported hypothetical protein [Actinacidiphila bryophytorum]